MKEKVLGQANRCIYCLHADGPLSKEHIVPYGLDGPYVLEAASCERCAAITSKIELYVLRTQLLHARMGQRMPTRRPNQRPKTLPIRFESAGVSEIREVPVDDQPLFLALPLFDLPVALAGDRARTGRKIEDEVGDRGIDLIQVGGRPMREFMDELRGERAGAELRGRVRPALFARFIAKIAHGFAVAHRGLDGAEYWLRGAILRETQDVGHWVGCDLDQPPVKGDGDPHWCQLETHPDGTMIVRVQLFAQFATQEYIALAGRAH